MARKGLVLEGGALRGLFSAGVIDVLMEAGIAFDGLIGVSAGAAFGCNYKSRQVGRVIRYNTRFARDWRYCSWKSWWLTGDLFGGTFCYHVLPEQLDVFDKKTFDENPMEYYAVCTDVETGEPVYQRLMTCSDTCYEYIRASASMPLVSKIVEVEGRKLLDGGVSDSIPLEYFQSVGYEKNVVVLTQPDGYRKEHNRLMPLLRLSLRKYPDMLRALDTRHLMYNSQLDYVREAERQGRAFVLRPPHALEIGHLCHDPEVMRAVYAVGRTTAEGQLSAIRKYLSE